MPIILCTGFSHTANEASAKAVGIKGFVDEAPHEEEDQKDARQVAWVAAFE
jgi:hypothetical protein